MNGSKSCAVAMGLFMIASVGLAGKKETKKFDQKACLKASGVYDEKTLDTLMKCHEGLTGSETDEQKKAKVNGCLESHKVTLNEKQMAARHDCHQKMEAEKKSDY